MAIDTHGIVSLFHIFFVAPLLLVIGFMRAGLPEWSYWGILMLGLFIMVYHGYKMIIRYLYKSESTWINAIHVFTVAPLLIYIGYKKRETLRFAYELMIMIGFAALGYHTIFLIRSIETLEAHSK